MEILSNFSFWASIWGLIVLVGSTYYNRCISKAAKQEVETISKLTDPIEIINQNTEVIKNKSEKLLSATRLTFALLIISYFLSIVSVVRDSNNQRLHNLETRLNNLEGKPILEKRQ